MGAKGRAGKATKQWGKRPTPHGRRVIQTAGVGALAALSIFAPGCHGFDDERELPSRGTVGEEIYGVVCDRVGAQALREDLSGASFRSLCHRGGDGKFADKVDESKLPQLDANAVDADGAFVSLEKQKDDRRRAIGRVESLARRRTDLVFALDSAFPDGVVPVRDLENEDETKSCTPKKAAGRLTDELANLLGRMGDLYGDGTLPDSTRSLATVVEAFQKSPEAQGAWARVSGREGYRPVSTALGAIRPLLSYPRLRELSNATLRLVSADSEPMALNAPRDAAGSRIPVAGPGNDALNALLQAGRLELGTVVAEPKPPAMITKRDAAVDRVVLSRPREDSELLDALLLKTNPAFGNGTMNWIVKRDKRGAALVVAPNVAPFVDLDGDGHADVDASGRFVSMGQPIPSPFPYARSNNAAPPVETARDQFGRALIENRLAYEYINTSETFAAQLARDLGELANPAPPEKRETIMDLARGLRVITGDRVKKTKQYGDQSFEYDAIRTDDSPLLDLVYAGAVVLGDRNTDTLLAYVKKMWVEHPDELARLLGAVLDAADIAKKYESTSLPAKSTFWDEMLDVLADVAKEPGLLEDLMASMADGGADALGRALASYARNKDEISYDPNNLNGAPFNITTNSSGEPSVPVDRSAPLTGKNRSILQRFLQLINDTDGVTVCNKKDSQIYACQAGACFPDDQVFKFPDECSVFKIDNVAKYYVDVLGEAWRFDPKEKPNKRGSFFIRSTLLQAFGSINMLEESSNIYGFLPPPEDDKKLFAPSPKWLNRVVFFDFERDNTPANARTKRFLASANGAAGTLFCAERVIPDPAAAGEHPMPDVAPDKMIRGLRTCGPGQTLIERDGNTLFALEHYGFYEAVRPLVQAFVKHNREDLFIKLQRTLFVHYMGKDASDEECKLPDGKMCPRDGLVNFEPALAEILNGDLLPALSNLIRSAGDAALTRCDVTESATNACPAPKSVKGTEVLAQASRSLLDPTYAKDVLQLTDRHGKAQSKRKDGSLNPQVTPANLLLNAFSAFSERFDRWEAEHPQDNGDRRAALKRATSQLADRFLAVSGKGREASFVNPGMKVMVPELVDVLRSQLFAHCPTSFSPPYAPCDWARKELPKRAEELISGPLTSTAIDVIDAIAADPDSRKEVTLLLAYLLDPGNAENSLPSVLATGLDLLQLMHDDQNVVPLMKFAASTMAASTRDATGKITQKSFVDAQMSLLSRVSGRRFTEDGAELCSREIDPNGILGVVLKNLVTPLDDSKLPPGKKANFQTPLEILVDVIVDVNRADPSQPYDGGLKSSDYATVGANVVDFLTNKERGLEQLYEVIRQGMNASKSED